MIDHAISIEQLSRLIYSQLTLVDFSIAYIYLYIVYKVIRAYFYLRDEDQPNNFKLNRTFLFSAIFICLSYFLEGVLINLNLGVLPTDREFLTGLSSFMALLLIFLIFIATYLARKFVHKIPIIGEIITVQENEYESVRDGVFNNQIFRGVSVRTERTDKNIPTDLILNFLAFVILLSVLFKFEEFFVPTFLLLLFFFHNHVFHIWSTQKPEESKRQ